MAKQKAWDEIHKLRLTGIKPTSINIFLRTELPKARRIVEEIQRSHLPIDITIYRSRITELIKK